MEPDRRHPDAVCPLDVPVVMVADHGHAFGREIERPAGAYEHCWVRLLDAKRLGNRPMDKALLEAVRPEDVLACPDSSVRDDRHLDPAPDQCTEKYANTWHQSDAI